MKSLLLALSLFSVSSVALAQSSEKSVSQPYSSADTIITLSEDDLLRAVRTVAEARLAADGQQSLHGFTAEDLRLVKLQMLLGALGLSGATPTHSMPTGANGVSCPYATRPAYQAQPQLGTARLDRLEQMLLLLLQRRESERSALVLPARSAKGQKQAPLQQTIVDNSSSDSLLRVLQQELIALRAAQQAQQPQVIIQQPQQVQQPQVVVQQPAGEIRVAPVVSYFKRQVFFPLGKSELLPEARLTLNEVYRVLSGDPAMKLYLTGYASPEGNAAQNERLSRLRSQAVLDYLTACGVSSDRLISVAGGVDRNTDLKSSARRVDIDLMK